MQGNYVFVFELFHKRDFADGGARGALFAVEVNFFQGDEFACLAVTPFKDLEEISAIGAGRHPRVKPYCCISSLAQLRKVLVNGLAKGGGKQLPSPAAGMSWDVSYPCLRLLGRDSLLFSLKAYRTQVYH